MEAADVVETLLTAEALPDGADIRLNKKERKRISYLGEFFFFFLNGVLGAVEGRSSKVIQSILATYSLYCNH